MRRDPLITDAPLIIGGGPAGTAAAITLGLAGFQPVLVERTTGPTDKVCGDFLSIDAIQRARALGVDPVALGATPIDRIRLIHGKRTAETALPFPAFGLSRRVLDAALLLQAEHAGAIVQTGQTVRRIDRTHDGWLAQIARIDPIAASDVFLATGKHDLHGRPRPGTDNGAIGMKMYYDLAERQTASLTGAIELILYPGGYAGLQCVEGGRAVICIAVQRKRFHDAGSNWLGLLASISAVTPYLDDVLTGATPRLPRPLAVAGIPYGWLHTPDGTGSESSDGFFRLGDQAAVIPSLTGDGIAMALHSGKRAAQVWLDDGDAPAYHRRLARELGSQMRLARLLHGACMFGPLQPAVVRGAALFPGFLREAARGTRLRPLR
jgi:menaquinone-9 beta-reductase